MVSKREEEEEYLKILEEYEKNQKLITGPVEDLLTFEKEKKREYNQRPEQREKKREYRQRPEQREKKREYDREYYQRKKEAKK
tara:strand:+ start:742 stop:990 length:249 start_codon:yes stop_codon:yes gene_type:complete